MRNFENTKPIIIRKMTKCDDTRLLMPFEGYTLALGLI